MIFSRALVSIALCYAMVPQAWGQTAPGRFDYIVDGEDLPVPKYRLIETGLPAGIAKDELLRVIDPREQSAWRFGWFSYGESNSRSVAVGLRGDGGAELYVDLDRDKRFARGELVLPNEEQPDLWRVPLTAEFVANNNQHEQVERSILIRRPRRGGLLEIATEGVMRGKVRVGQRLMAAIRVDRDSNGRWFDARDRILLDTSGDGKVDSIGGRISCDSICRIDGKRFVLQSDQRGEQLEMIELSGVGKIVPRIELPEQVQVKELSGVFVSRAGVRASIRGSHQEVECPVGNYRVESLTLHVRVDDAEYWFRFAGQDENNYAIAVKVGESVEADLIGEVRLTSQQAAVELPTGKVLSITPRLSTTSGLYLTGCKSGRGKPTLENRLLTQSTVDDQVVDNNSTGFS